MASTARLGAPPLDSVLVAGDLAAATRQQQERLWSLIRRGRQTLLIAAALMFGALAVGTARGDASWSAGLLVVVALAIAGIFALIDRRLASRPPGSVEVPKDLASLIVEISQIRDEIRIYGPDTLPPDVYQRVVDTVGKHVNEIIASAARTLVAERSGERDTSVALRADIERRFEAVMDIYEEIDMHDALADQGEDAERPDGSGQEAR